MNTSNTADFSAVLAACGCSAAMSGFAIQGQQVAAPTGPLLPTTSPITGDVLARVRSVTPGELTQAIGVAHAVWPAWQQWPAPRRGEVVRRIGERVRAAKQDLAALITAEVGKVPSEAAGEVQEWIDICDFAVGLSRQLHGLTIVSERPNHRMMEQWHPIGPVGVISAFNFPVAVWAWNAMLALVCGDTVVWKPSEKASLCAMAVHKLCAEVLDDMEVPAGVLVVAVGDAAVGQALTDDQRVPLISATGSVPMGRAVAQRVAARLGRSLLELGGNNCAIVAPSADIELAVRGILFSAVGTAGQRCTTLRRLLVHESIYASVVPRLIALSARVPIGDPRQAGILVGPLIDAAAGQAFERALATAKAAGGLIHGGGRVVSEVPSGGYYPRPAWVEIDLNSPIVAEETFAPIVYIGSYTDFSEAVRLHNAVPQGLSSAIFTTDIREAEQFMAPWGSDCGIANVNIGTSGAEIGGAFGGEKWTGGGRESGSDAWKAYMRRTTNTVNYGVDLPLAQGIRFDL